MRDALVRNDDGLGKLMLPEAVAHPRTPALPHPRYSTVTLFARFLGWSTFSPRFAAM